MTLEDFIRKFIEQSKKGNIVVFTGAGLSTASGIKDFRGQNGLYKENVYAEYILSKECFNLNPELFYDFYKKYLIVNESIMPNEAHLFIKKLEDEGLLKLHITQNIDGLDKKAGSKKLVEIHGNAHQFYCPGCRARFATEDILKMGDIPICEKCGKVIKPDIVLYNESLDQSKLMEAQDAAIYATTMLVMGSSLKVYPAASIVRDFIFEMQRDKNKKLFIVNMGKTDFDGFKIIDRYDGDVISFVKECERCRKNN